VERAGKIRKFFLRGIASGYRRRTWGAEVSGCQRSGQGGDLGFFDLTRCLDDFHDKDIERPPHDKTDNEHQRDERPVT